MSTTSKRSSASALLVLLLGVDARDTRTAPQQSTHHADARQLHARLQPGELTLVTIGALQYEVFAPATYAAGNRLHGKAGRRHPVLVFMHGRGESGSFHVTNAQSLPLQLSMNRTFAVRFPFLALIPQCPQACAEKNGWLPHVQRSIAAALHEVVFERWGGDPERTYLAGQSMGGHGAWMFAAQQPRLFAGLVVVCGYAQGPEQAAAIAERLERQRLPVAVYHSADDVVIPVAAGDEMVAALRRVGYGRDGRAGAPSLRVTRYEHAPPPPMAEFAELVGHGAYELAFRERALYGWLLQQRCRPCGTRPPSAWRAIAS